MYAVGAVGAFLKNCAFTSDKNKISERKNGFFAFFVLLWLHGEKVGEVKKTLSLSTLYQLRVKPKTLFFFFFSSLKPPATPQKL